MFKKIMSFVLIITLFTSSISSFSLASTQNMSEAEVLKTIYESLSDEAKVIFNEQIKSDSILMEVHESYVGEIQSPNLDDSDLYAKFIRLPNDGYQENAVSMNTAGTLDVLKMDLQLLRLSAPLYYALIGEASSLIAAGVDGPFPVGDVVGLVVAALSTVVVAFYAMEFIEKYPGIKAAFTKAFKSSASQIAQGLDQVYNKCVDWVAGNSGSSTITVDGVSYRCDTRAEEVALEMKRKQILYYPAILKNNAVWVCTVEIDRSTALKIMSKNDEKIGVFAITANRAIGLCSGLGGVRGPENHGAGEGFWSHYHGTQAPKAHCWYIE